MLWIRKSRFVLALGAMALTTASQAAGTVSVLKTSGCSCCLAWIRHLEAASFVVEAKNVSMGELMQTKLKAGLKPELTSCHTGKVAGYVVEGHVPVREVRRLVKEQPDAIGLTVPGMPLGSPGMETNGPDEPYDVLLVRKDGTTEVYARYPRP